MAHTEIVASPSARQPCRVVQEHATSCRRRICRRARARQPHASSSRASRAPLRLCSNTHPAAILCSSARCSVVGVITCARMGSITFLPCARGRLACHAAWAIGVLQRAGSDAGGCGCCVAMGRLPDRRRCKQQCSAPQSSHTHMCRTCCLCHSVCRGCGDAPCAPCGRITARPGHTQAVCGAAMCAPKTCHASARHHISSDRRCSCVPAWSAALRASYLVRAMALAALCLKIASWLRPPDNPRLQL